MVLGLLRILQLFVYLHRAGEGFAAAHGEAGHDAANEDQGDNPSHDEKIDLEEATTLDLVAVLRLGTLQ